MTDVSNLDDLAAKIASGKYPNIAAYAKAQALVTQAQEVEIRKLRADVEALKLLIQPAPPPPPPPAHG